MDASKKKDITSYIHAGIGIGIVAIFFILAEVNPTPFTPITPIGLKCLGIFVSMIYLWSAVGTLWPSLFGLVMLGLIGIGEGKTAVAAFNDVLMNAIGGNCVLQVLFIFILFGAVDYVGTTKHIARFILTRKFYRGHPYLFLLVFYFAGYVISGFVGLIVGLVMLWPIAIHILNALAVNRQDKIWRYFYMGMFLAMALGLPLIPFKGAPLVPLSVFAAMTAKAGTPLVIPYAQYMLANFVMTWIVMFLYVGIIKLMRIDASKLSGADPEAIDRYMNLPTMNFQQKVYLWMIPIYILAILLPGFFPHNPVSQLLNSLGVTGVTICFTIVFIVWHWDGKPMLDFQKVAAKHMNWGVFFMIASAVYVATTLSNPATGITPWIMQTLKPVLGGRSEMVFVGLMFTTALIITNFANNAAMAIVLMPIVIGFSTSIGINPVPVAAGVVLMVFVAMLTPAASPGASMMWGRRDLYSPKDIISIGLPMCIITLVCYIFIGYPLLKMLMC